MYLHMIRFALIGLFSMTAASLILFQSLEVFHAFLDIFTGFFHRD
ncbi:hypothetical protein [Fictibacillus enclensis]|nr:hypothetical protein [Fictibacillus enclensis]WHY73327.1 hypothetical protein QNH15_05280 [Fictibacillus enclensis]